MRQRRAIDEGADRAPLALRMACRESLHNVRLSAVEDAHVHREATWLVVDLPDLTALSRCGSSLISVRQRA